MAEPVHTAGTEVPGEEHHEATALGLNAGGFVALAMLVVFAILIWKKVPAAIARSLDDKIAAIRSQLDEAKALREEAEGLRREYEKKAKSADKEAKAMIERARLEAEAIVAKADSDAGAMIERRTRMAEEKIAAEERAAINELRASAAAAATRAAEKLIAERHDASADARLVEQAISGLGKSA
jgi:F-type H+-transporting ATPase subunit b